MELETLIDYTVNFLNILAEQYRAEKITFEFFKSSSELKIKFLKENLSKIDSAEQKQQIESTLRIYDKFTIRR